MLMRPATSGRGTIMHVQISQISLHHVTIRTFDSSLALHVRIDVDVLRDVDVDRPKGEVGRSPGTLTGRITAGGGRSVVVGTQA